MGCRALMVAAAAVLGLASEAGAAPHVVVWLPGEGGPPAAEVEKAFGWARRVEVLDAAGVPIRFPPSQAAQVRLADEARVEALLAEAERAFVETRFPVAAKKLKECAERAEALFASVRANALWMRTRLMQGRVELALGHKKAADAAFAEAAQAAPDAPLDEAEYPPDVWRAFETARKRAAGLKVRTARVGSDPSGAEVEVNGRPSGRTPLTVKLPPGRCRIHVASPGFVPGVAPCGASGDIEVRLAPVDPAARGDQIRERLVSDPRWYLEPAWLDLVAAETGAGWTLALEKGRGDELDARLYSTAARSFRPLSPARFGPTQAAPLAAAAREAILASESLTAEMRDPSGDAPRVEVRAADPASVAKATLFVRRGQGDDFVRVELGRGPGGLFAAAVPPELASDGPTGLDLEYWVQGLDEQGKPWSHAGDALQLLRFHRAPAAPASPAPPAVIPWYGRWYVWAGAGAVVASATTAYLATRPGKVAITFGSPP